ncbi:BspA family leucine-rich repeat surface protein [Flavobacterium sp. DGU11]|uniref:BspA family leucine-rich repeat surface protein n=1 Tax=Flavobacterium arundinis TaxID=3139143 RepID=A0ABU9HT25_9FLAO
MRKLYLLFAFVFFSAAYGQEPFITTWEVPDNNSGISVPIQAGTGVNYTVNFGDGTILHNITGPIYHTYTISGTYTVTISGNYYQFKSESDSYSFRLKTIEQWGDAQWTSMEQAFKNCANMVINAADSPDLSHVTSMKEMFSFTNFNQSINNWDVSNVTDMRDMFSNAFNFNQPLDNWDVSNVTNMSGMFSHAYRFNQPLNTWNVSNVTNTSGMFNYAYDFNQPLDNWDVSNITNMSNMFGEAHDFNQPLNNWDVSNVTNMRSVLGGTSFNQPLDNWDVSNVNDMSGMLGGSPFNQPLNGWDVSNVTTMSHMFANGEFNQPLNNWDVSNVTSMYSMFYGADSFNQPLNNWDVSNVTDMESMFGSATAFNQPLNNWDVSNVIYMNSMFFYALIFNQNISDWSFNSDVYLPGFLAQSGIDINNYDAVLLKFAQLEIENDTFFDATGLHYCNVGVRDYLINTLNWNIVGDSLGAECQGNTISGTVHFDQNNNGCEATDIPVRNFLIKANDGTFDYASSTNATGAYNVRVMENTYTTTLINVPNYYTVTPQQQTVAFTGFGGEQEVNFCLTANQSVQDLNITLLPITGTPRPGFTSHYQLIAQNIGTQTVANASVSLAYDNAIQSFASAIPAATSATAGQLTFDLTNLQPFESRVIAITMQTLAPPTVNGGEVINFTASVTPNTGDFTAADNTFALAQTVVNSFDPNDKQVLQGDEISLEQAEGYLDYLIRFQNTGSASAITVRIEDNLPENVDWTTLRPVSSSHPYTLKLKDDNTVEFIFDNINLPHEAADEPGSHGFIAYKIKPLETIAFGDIITGNAEIYFDYNLPIVTNFATTEVMDAAGINDNIANRVTIYPNPVSDVLYLHASNGITIEEVEVINLQGRELMSFTNSTEGINVENLSSGVYILVIKTDAEIVKHKLVRK